MPNDRSSSCRLDHGLAQWQDVAEDYHRKSKAWQRHLEDQSGRERIGREPLNLVDDRVHPDVREFLKKHTPDESGTTPVNLHELAPLDILYVLDNVVYAWKVQGFAYN